MSLRIDEAISSADIHAGELRLRGDRLPLHSPEENHAVGTESAERLERSLHDEVSVLRPAVTHNRELLAGQPAPPG